MITSRRVSYLMITSLVLLTLAIIGCTYAASNMLAERAAILQELKVQDAVLSQEKLSLTKAKKDVVTYASLESIAKSIVPQDKNQAQTVREIVKIAAESGISPSSITFPASNLASGPAGVAATRNALTQLTPVKGAVGLYILPITITQSSTNYTTFPRLLTFLSKLEQNRRTAQVSSISLQPNAKDRSQLAFTLTVNEYIKP